MNNNPLCITPDSRKHSLAAQVTMKTLLFIIFVFTKSLARSILDNPPGHVEFRRDKDVIHISRTNTEAAKKLYNAKENEKVNDYNKYIATSNKITVKMVDGLNPDNKDEILKKINTVETTPCCNGVSCFPCPYPMPMAYPAPVPQIPQIPIVVPAQTFYEPVIHDHPPLHQIKSIIEKGKRRKRKRDDSHYIDSTDSCDTSDMSDSSDSSDSDDINSSVDYYDDVLQVRAP